MDQQNYTGNTDAITDLSFLKIYASGNPAMMKQFIQAFLEKTPIAMKQLEDQFAAGDLYAVSRTAHSLKPQFSYMGFAAAQDVILPIEELAKEGRDNESILSYIGTLKHLLDRAYAELNQQLSSL